MDGTRCRPAFAEALAGDCRLEVIGERVTVHGIASSEVPLVSRVVSQLGRLSIRFHDLRTEQPTLEDVFLKLTGREMRE